MKTTPSRTPQKFALRPIALAISLLALNTVVPVFAQAAPTGSGIFQLNMDEDESYANGVSADGTVVVGDYYKDSLNHAFRWTSSGITDLGTLGGDSAYAKDVSADGSVIVGHSHTGSANQAFRWTSGGMLGLGIMGTASYANGVSADGNVVVGYNQDTIHEAFRWVKNDVGESGTMYNLVFDIFYDPDNRLHSRAEAASEDGSVVVGYAYDTSYTQFQAFRWVKDDVGESGTAISLGTLGGVRTLAKDVSNDGTVVVGYSYLADSTNYHAFRWVEGATTGIGSNPEMFDLGTLGGNTSYAYGVSADGAVVVGESHTGSAYRAFRWVKDAEGETGTMQSVEDWLRGAGVTVEADITRRANATNSDGSVVVGYLQGDLAYIARVSDEGSGLVTVEDLQESLGAAASGVNMALESSNLVISGAHSRPLMRLVDVNKNAFWVAGDVGQDDHGERNGDLGLAEVGIGHNFGNTQLNAAIGHTWANQDLVNGGSADVDGTYLLAEALIPVKDSVWLTLGGYYHWANTDLRRGYDNGGTPDYSTGSPDMNTWSIRARLDAENSFAAGSVGFSPYADLSYTKAKLDAYTETGGGFPATFDERTDKATELRLGVNAAKTMSSGMKLLGTLEAAHRFEDDSAITSGEVIGLSSFNFSNTYDRNWWRLGIGMEGEVGAGQLSVMVNGTTKGEVPSAWLAANWVMPF